jgi:Fe2+ or Zn2+ uptake regulation protein
MAIEDDLRGAGLRVTAQRLTVLDCVRRLPHSTADEIAAQCRGMLGTISTQAVYDCLEALLRTDLIRRIEPAGSAARFEGRVGDNHHHVVCRHCGRTADVDCVVGSRPCLNPSTTIGFIVDEAEITFWGLCPGCQSSTSANPTPPS